RLQLLLDESNGALNLQPANVCASENIPGGPGGYRNLREAEDAGGKVLTCVAFDTAGPSCWADHSQSQADVSINRARALEASLHRGRVPEEIGRVLDVPVGRLETFQALLPPFVVQVEPNPSRPHQASAEAIAADQGGQVQEIATYPSAVRRRRKKANIAGKGAQVA